MSAVAAYRAYTQNQAATASPARLLVLLLEAAQRHLRSASVELERGQRKAADVALRKAGDIVWELSQTLDARRAPELARSLADVYGFVSFKILESITRRDPGAAREAERVLAPLVEAFRGAVAQAMADGTAR